MLSTGWLNSKIIASFQDADKVRQLNAIFNGQGVRMDVFPNLDEVYKILSIQKPDVVIVEPALDSDGPEILLSEFLGHCRNSGITVILVIDDARQSLPSCCWEVPRANFPFVAEDVAFQIAAEYQIRQLKEEISHARSLLEAKEKELNQCFKSAAFIQRSLIPQEAPRVEEFSFGWQFLPKDHGSVGGDLFNILRLDENHLGVYILDVSGHSFPAAMVTVSISQSLDPRIGQVVKKKTNYPPFYRIATPSEVLAYLNQEYPVERFEKFFTICYAVLDMRSGRVCYSNAGHPFPVLIRRDGRAEPLTGGGTIVGLIDAPFPDEEVTMEPGDRLYFFTDGIPEHQNGHGSFFGENRLYETLAGCTHASLKDTCKKVVSSLMNFGEQSVRDDITLLGFEYRGSKHSAC